MAELKETLPMQQLVKHSGGCHCGAVRFELRAPTRVVVQECNCSICSKSGYLHLIVPASRFHLLCGDQDLNCYTFDTGEAKHLFCKHCGIKSYYIPRSNPDGFSVNLRCLDEGTIKAVEIEAFDGKNWEQNAAQLADLSNDDELSVEDKDRR
ncbi:MAG: GFA family protein [Gammaproteobacteria bacterium]|nr:GFA family protein [Gammaproteobacteria bacterium]